MRRVDACKLDRVIKKHYGREFGVPTYMEGQRKIEASVSKICDDQKPFLQNFIDGKEPANGLDRLDTFEAILCDLCSKDILKESDYLICFDD